MRVGSHKSLQTYLGQKKICSKANNFVFGAQSIKNR